MFKLFMCIIIISCCGILGIIKSGTYSQRIRELNDLRNMMHMLDTEIKYRKDPLQLIFRRLASQKQGISSSILGTCSTYMDSYQPFSDCWTTAVNEVCASSCLKKNDIAVLKELSGWIGNSSPDGQSSMFSLMEEHLQQQINEASAEKNAKGKMYGGLGFTVGILISVLLI